jgi:bifunctional non-homologous end joining protein LigD
VSAPIDWDELDDPDLTPDAFTIRTMPRRLNERGDLFHDVLDHPQRLPPL